SLEVKNDESLFLYKKIAEGVTLIVICEGDVSMPLVNMTTSMLLAELKASADLLSLQPTLPEFDVSADDLGAIQSSLAEFDVTSEPEPQPEPAVVPEEPADQPEPAVAPEEAADSQPESSVVDVDKLMKEGSLAPIASKLEDAMSRAIGPIGSMVVRDCVETWVQGGGPSPGRYNELLDLLLKEIGDSQLEDEFKQEVGSLLS
nr:hypothetical protein [Desulfobulbaceae bacterium]